MVSVPMETIIVKGAMVPRTILFAFFSNLLCLASGVACVAGDFDLAAGAARIDLTPPLEWGVSLGGYGERMNRPATGIHDRIHAKSIVLRKGDKRFALVTLDVLALPPAVKTKVVEALSPEGWDGSQILLLPSHSHTSLDLGTLDPRNTLGVPQIRIFDARLLDHVVKKLLTVIHDASRTVEPVAVGTGSAQVPGRARRRRPGEPVTDPELTVKRIDRVGGKPLAILVNWTAHPTFFGPEHMEFSAGWPGYLQRELEAWIEGGITALYFNGAQGDQAPVGPVKGGTAHEQVEAYGREIAIQALAIYRRIELAPAARLDFARSTLRLPSPRAHPDFMKTGGAEYGLDEKKMKTLLEAMTSRETEVGVLLLGDLLIAGVPGELECGLGLQLKKALRGGGALHPVIGGLANEWVSYMLSPEEYERGGYEASVSFYGPDLASAVVSKALEAAQLVLARNGAGRGKP